MQYGYDAFGVELHHPTKQGARGISKGTVPVCDPQSRYSNCFFSLQNDEWNLFPQLLFHQSGAGFPQWAFGMELNPRQVAECLEALLCPFTVTLMCLMDTGNRFPLEKNRIAIGCSINPMRSTCDALCSQTANSMVFKNASTIRCRTLGRYLLSRDGSLLIQIR